MIPIGHLVVLNDAEHDRYQVLRVEARLTRRLYLVARVCPNHEVESNDLSGRRYWICRTHEARL